MKCTNCSSCFIGLKPGALDSGKSIDGGY